MSILTQETSTTNRSNTSDGEKLRKAVALAISAGYQLNQEAFGFLSMIVATEDPTEIIDKALRKLNILNEKPFFIDKHLLETLLENAPENIDTNLPDAKLQEQFDLEHSQPSEATSGKKHFQPYAKEVEKDLSIIENPSSKISSDGTVEDFSGYFQDRFRRIERLLRQRIDVRSAASIRDALRTPANTKLKVIGMITEKREAKQRVILSVEDLEANITALVPQNASEELRGKARLLMLDQVVCLSAMKSRSGLLIVEDIILPEVGQKPSHKATEKIYAVLTSDIHIGSIKFQRSAFNNFILWLNGKYGNEQLKEVASHVKYVLIAGDIVDGVGIYPNQPKELAVKDVHKQYRLATKYIEQIPDYIEVLVIPGNHDTPRKALPQPAISGAYLETLQESRNVHSLGNPCYVSIHGVEVLMYHGRSLDDVISTVPGMSNNNPEKAMRLLLQSRHLAPLYGGKTTLSPEERDFLVIERVPDVFHAGHIHALGCCNYRGVSIINSGGWQEQTEYMKKFGFIPTCGKVPVINLQTLETTVVPFS